MNLFVKSNAESATLGGFLGFGEISGCCRLAGERTIWLNLVSYLWIPTRFGETAWHLTTGAGLEIAAFL